MGVIRPARSTDGAAAQRAQLLDQRRLLPVRGGADLLGADEWIVPVSGDEHLYRLSWELLYADGRVLRQFERVGETVLQRLFGRLDPSGVAAIGVIDMRPYRPQPVARIDLPLGAFPDCRADILYNCSMAICGDGVSQIGRIYSFGWHSPAAGKSQYWHFDPSVDPIRLKESPARILTA